VSKTLSCLFISFYKKKIQDNHLIFWSLDENLPLIVRERKRERVKLSKICYKICYKIVWFYVTYAGNE